MENATYVKQGESLKPQEGRSDAFEKRYADLMDLAVHDLDAPLRKLTLLVGMLTNKVTGDSEMQSYVERINGCVDTMRSLIDDLSLLGRITGKDVRHSSCSLDEIVQEALQELPASVKDKQAAVNSLPLPVIEGDEQLLVLLFKNIFINAIKFSKKNFHPSIRIDSDTLTQEERTHLGIEDKKNYYKIIVSDEGIGFKTEDAEKIFDPFVRLHGKSQFSGNGLGLAICRKIMEIHDGIIYAEGREAEGARFILILPESH